MFSLPDLVFVVLYLIGLGATMAWPLRASLGSVEGFDPRKVPLDQALGLGLCITLAIVLLHGHVPAAVLLVGGCVGGVALWRRWIALPVNGSRAVNSAILAVAALLVTGCLFVPLIEWDARSIWFHHAKILFHFGADWNYMASIGFSHADYPKLLPATAATIATAIGGWSDSHAKFASFLIALPLLLMLARLSPAAAMGLAVAWAQSLYGVASGYLDALVALASCSVAALLADRLLLEKNRRAMAREDVMIGAALATALLINLKNEGLFCAAALMIALLPFWTKHAHTRPRVGSVAALLLMILPTFLVWAWIKDGNSLRGDLLHDGVPAALARMRERVQDPAALASIGKALALSGIGATWAVFAVLAWLTRRINDRSRVAAAYLLTASVTYTAVLALVYLATPMDLQWHLLTSVERVTTTSVYLGYVAIAYLVMPSAQTSGLRHKSDVAPV